MTTEINNWAMPRRDASTIIRRRLILYDYDVEGRSSREGEGDKEEERPASEVRCVFQVVGTCKTSAGFARIMITVTTAHSSAIADHVKEAE